MKKFIILFIIILLFSFILVSVPKKELPTDLEWEEFLEYEEQQIKLGRY